MIPRRRFIVFALLTSSVSAAAQMTPPAWPVQVDGGVMSGPADETTTGGMAAARLSFGWPATTIAIDASTPLESVRRFQPAALGVGTVLRRELIHAGPDAIQVNGLFAARYGTLGGRGGATVRVDAGEMTGVWVAASVGDMRVDSLGASYDEQEAPIGLSVASLAPDGSGEFGGGVWHRDGAFAFGASATGGWTRYVADVVSTHPGVLGVDSVPESLGGTADTALVARYATTVLTRVWASWSVGRLAIDVAGGARANAHLPTVGWVSGTAAVTIIPPVAFAVSAGNRGSPIYERPTDREARGYLAVGVQLSRWALGRPRPPALSSPSDLVTGYRFVTNGDGQRFLVVVAPSARRVGVRGDFTSWSDIAATRIAGGAWEVPLPPGAGVYHVAIRIDARGWQPLPGAAVTQSEYGDMVGVIIVP